MFKNKYIIVDDFYPNPDLIREHALSLKYEDKTKGNYPGVMSETGLILPEFEKIFNDLTGEVVVPSSSPFTGKFRIIKKGDEYKQHIHFDPNCIPGWAGIIFLSKPEDYTLVNGNTIETGTTFWKHKRTGLDEIPLTDVDLKNNGWNNVKEVEKFLNTEGLDEKLWIKQLTIPFKYNRLILFRPWLFHSAGPGFGTTNENSRLIQLFFLSSKPNE